MPAEKEKYRFPALNAYTSEDSSIFKGETTIH
jgi:hypothetical protein